jgi:hypothetical protein
VLPVIQTGASDLPFVEREAKRFDQVQPRPGRKARPAGIAGIPVDLGMNEDDVNQSTDLPLYSSTYLGRQNSNYQKRTCAMPNARIAPDEDLEQDLADHLECPLGTGTRARSAASTDD